MCIHQQRFFHDDEEYSIASDASYFKKESIEIIRRKTCWSTWTYKGKQLFLKHLASLAKYNWAV